MFCCKYVTPPSTRLGSIRETIRINNIFTRSTSSPSRSIEWPLSHSFGMLKLTSTSTCCSSLARWSTKWDGQDPEALRNWMPTHSHPLSRRTRDLGLLTSRKRSATTSPKQKECERSIFLVLGAFHFSQTNLSNTQPWLHLFDPRVEFLIRPSLGLVWEISRKSFLRNSIYRLILNLSK
jgi:hypothetical protein